MSAYSDGQVLIHFLHTQDKSKSTERYLEAFKAMTGLDGFSLVVFCLLAGCKLPPLPEEE